MYYNHLCCSGATVPCLEEWHTLLILSMDRNDRPRGIWFSPTAFVCSQCPMLPHTFGASTHLGSVTTLVAELFDMTE